MTASNQRNTRRVGVVWFTAACCVLSLADCPFANAQAYSVTYYGQSQLNIPAAPFRQSLTTDTGPLAQTSYTQAPVNAALSGNNETTGVFNSASATNSGFITYGAASGHASATAAGDDSMANAYAEGFFSDNVTVMSATLPMGTEVTLLFTMSLNDSILTNNTDNDANVFAQFSNTSGYSYDANAPAPPNVVQGSLTAMVGEQFAVNGNLEAIATPDATYLVSGNVSYATVNATATYNIDSLTAGVTVIGASGHNYASATASAAEPGELALLISLLVPAGVRIAGRRRLSVQNGDH